MKPPYRYTLFILQNNTSLLVVSNELLYGSKPGVVGFRTKKDSFQIFFWIALNTVNFINYHF